MAATNYTPIQLYNSGTTGNAPSAGNLAAGELAINYTDGKLFYKDNSAAVQVIAWKTTPTTAGGTGLTSYTAGDLPYYASGTALSKLAIGSANYVLTSSGSAPQYVAQSTLSVGSATNATNTAITDNTSSSATWYPTIVSATTGNLPQTTSSTKLSFVPSTGTLTATNYAGTWAGNTIGVGYGGTGATSFTAGQILFGNGSSAINSNSAFFWDNTNYRIGIGTNSPSYSLDINAYQGPIIRLYDSYGVPAGGSYSKILFAGNQAPSGFAQIYAAGVYYSGSYGQIIVQTDNGSGLTGGVSIANGGTSWSSYSDPRLKNITGTYTTPLTDIVQIKPIKFTWKSDTTKKPCVGLDATTVQTVIPEAVSLSQMSQEDTTQYLTVSYTEVIPLCIAAIQALITEVQTLQAQVSALTPKQGT